MNLRVLRGTAQLCLVQACQFASVVTRSIHLLLRGAHLLLRAPVARKEPLPGRGNHVALLAHAGELIQDREAARAALLCLALREGQVVDGLPVEVAREEAKSRLDVSDRRHHLAALSAHAPPLQVGCTIGKQLSPLREDGIPPVEALTSPATARAEGGEL
eukprot:768635-Hanusia_phi.AAC.6